MIDQEEEKRLDALKNDLPYMRFWSKILDKQDYHTEHGMFHYKNLRATIWILFFNPAIVWLYAIGAILLTITCHG